MRAGAKTSNGRSAGRSGPSGSATSGCSSSARPSRCAARGQTVAVGWLVIELTDSSGVAVGVVTALQYLPMLLFGVGSGVLADRFDKRGLLIAAQTFMAIPSAVLALVVGFDVVELWMVYACVIALGFGSC